MSQQQKTAGKRNGFIFIQQNEPEKYRGRDGYELYHKINKEREGEL